MKTPSWLVAAVACATLGGACGDESAGPRDAGARDGARVDGGTERIVDGGRPAGDGALRADGGGDLADSGLIDTRADCDAASYYAACDEDPSRILRCLAAAGGGDTVHSVPCPSGQRCLGSAGGGAACADADLGPCDPSHVSRCDGPNTRITCELYASPDGLVAGVEAREPCAADEECRALSDETGAACVPMGASSCDEATYVPSCHDDHLYYQCESEAVRTSDPCGGGYVCVSIADGAFTCVDAALTSCDPESFTETCTHAPDVAVVCDPTGYEVHVRCGATNPSCVVVAGHAGCSYPGAATCPLTGTSVCDDAAPEYVESCAAGIPMRKRCIVSTVAPTCACRPSTAGIGPDCYTEAGEPCASTDA